MCETLLKPQKNCHRIFTALKSAECSITLIDCHKLVQYTRWRRHEWKCDRKHGQICKCVAENQWPSLIENILELPVSGLNWSQLVDINDGPGSDWHSSEVHLQGSCYMQPLPVGKLLAASYEESCEDYTAVSLTMSVHCPALNSFSKLEWTLNHFPYIGLCDKEFVSIFLYEYHHRSLVLDKNLRKLYTSIVERRLKIKKSAPTSQFTTGFLVVDEMLSYMEVQMDVQIGKRCPIKGWLWAQLKNDGQDMAGIFALRAHT